ncbi:hypothetical protein ARMGADRAFT_1083718 [Armillaria gallica]|uniref:Uncharacterized protein n=1 Tax=Armillaria gallica TaxID=47427 RepID=A0A2H3D1J7_ARMGA|nr:hypothetical protein ARMGADRAFT_1083718 [Armillaria gallica]
MSTPKVQYDITEKGSDVDADDHYKTRVALPRTQKWYQWYNQDDTPEERRLDSSFWITISFALRWLLLEPIGYCFLPLVATLGTDSNFDNSARHNFPVPNTSP